VKTFHRHGRTEPESPRSGNPLGDADRGLNVDQGIKGEQVVAAMGRITPSRGSPKTIRVDNGPEFISKGLDRWT
jgi:hypothetical protein